MSLSTTDTETKRSQATICCISEDDQTDISLVDGSWQAQVRDTMDFLQDRLPACMVPEVFICVEDIPKNLSGKLDRKRMQEYVNNLDVSKYHDLMSRMNGEGLQYNDRPGSEIEILTRSIWSEVLRVPESQIHWDTSFFFLGGDSISAMMISHAARQRGMALTAGDILRHRRIDRLAEFVAKAQPPPPQRKATVPTPEIIVESRSFPLSPIQRLHFLTHGIFGDSLDQQTLILDVMQFGDANKVDQRLLKRAFQQLLTVHPMLRARFRVNNEGEIQQNIAANTDKHDIRLRLHSDSDTEYVLDCVREAQLSIDLSQGPLIAVDLFKEEGKSLLISISIHHLVIDTVSWRIILQDLQGFLLSGGLTPMSPEPVSFQEWCCALVEEFTAPQDEEHANGTFDTNFCHPTPPYVNDQSWEMQDKHNTFNETIAHTFELDVMSTTVLMAAREHTSFDLVDILCSALLMSFSSVFGRIPQLFIEGHGREPFRDKFVDVGSVVGWFTTFSPVCLLRNLNAFSEGNLQVIKEVHDSRQSMHLNGLACFSRQQLCNQARSTAPITMEMTLNYLGMFQQVENASGTTSIFNIHSGAEFQDGLSNMKLQHRANSTRYSLISVQFRHVEDTLCGEITWNKNMNGQEKILEWTKLFENLLSDMHCRLAKAPALQSSFEEGHSMASASSSVSLDLPATINVTTDTLRRVLETANNQAGFRAQDIERIYPCSPIQESIMLAQLKTHSESTSNVYDQHFLFEVVPPEKSTGIKVYRLHEAWREIVRRHAIMRTVFAEDNDGFFQVVLKQHSPDIEVAVPENKEHQDAIVDTLWSQNARQKGCLKHPLSGSVLHKLKIYERPSVEGIPRVFCILTKSHLISGGQTSRLLIKEFLDVYDGLETQPRVDYSEYIKYIYQQDLEETARWWAKFLEGADPCLLPRTLRRHVSHENQDQSEMIEGNTSTETFLRVGAAITDKESLSFACQRYDLTSTSILCAAWAMTLRTYIGNPNNVLFGLMFWGRDLPIEGANTILGPMINMLPARVQFTTAMTVVEVCQDFQTNYIEQLSRQTLPLARIQNDVQSLRGRGRIFNTMVNVQKSREGEDVQRSDRTRAELLFSHDTTEYDVALSVTETQQALKVTLEYRTDFMSQLQAKRLLQVFIAATETIIKDAACTIGNLTLATDLDISQLREWNSTPLNTHHGCIQEMIQATSSSLGHAERPAISSWDGHLTYRELDYLSSTLADMLVSEGVVPNEVVALCFEKSLWAVVSMLAVAKAGAAFVHIHPDYPYKRCRTIIDQTRSTLGLASKTHQHKLSGILTQGTVITVPWSSDCLSRIPVDVQDRGWTSHCVAPSNVMYMISTSGTTGTPKLVVIEHQSFCSAVAANMNRLQMCSESRVLQFTDYCFDACLEEIFTILVAGGCICIPSETQRLSGEIPAFIKKHNVNWAAFTPSFLRTIQPEDIIPPVKFITVHAEPMSQALVDSWARRVHMRPSYGPTECSVTSTVGAPFAPGSDASNIGWPVGCHAWVVSPDNHDILMPVGSVGELVLQGPIVGWGYLADDARTAASFISPPAWLAHVLGSYSAADSSLTSRMYKTGDLVRYDPEDGSLLIQRRKDSSQVKVRGQRIELQEIEHHLDNTGVLQHGIVLVPSHGELCGRIVAVVSLLCIDFRATVPNMQSDHNADGESPIKLVRMKDLDMIDADEVSRSMRTARKSLSRNLPCYMMPETWLVVEKLPVQISHKVNRQQVAGWVAEMDQSSLELVYDLELHKVHGNQDDELGEEERSIQSVWSQVLGIDPSRFLSSHKSRCSAESRSHELPISIHLP